MEIGKNLRSIKYTIGSWANFIRGIRPDYNFNPSILPPNPDYRKLKDWAAHPELKDKSSFRPNGESQKVGLKKANVFYIHPTSYFGNSNWNADLNHSQSRELVDELIVPAQASVFNQCCNIYAPRYRQATFYSFLSGGKNAQLALDLAYHDLKLAFEHFIKHFNQNEPFFIAGHSQGSLLAIKLLEDLDVDESLAKKLIAAYVPGYKIPLNKFDLKFRHIKKGLDRRDLHCVLSWDTFLEGSSPFSSIDNAITWVTDKKNLEGTWKKRIGYKPFAINPLTWNQSEKKTDLKEHKGAVVNVYSREKKFNWTNFTDDKPLGVTTNSLSKPIPNHITTQLRKDGILYISKPKNPLLKIGVMPIGNYHVYDYNLFYMNIQENIAERWGEYQKRYL